jgi:hypothetical protein
LIVNDCGLPDGSMGWVTTSYSPKPGSYQLFFEVANAIDNFVPSALAIDNVRVTTPEPSTLVLLTAGLLGMVSRRLIARAQQAYAYYGGRQAESSKHKKTWAQNGRQNPGFLGENRGMAGSKGREGAVFDLPLLILLQLDGNV